MPWAARFLRCSFCGADRRQVARLIAGQRGYICERCVASCIEITEREECGVGADAGEATVSGLGSAVTEPDDRAPSRRSA